MYCKTVISSVKGLLDPKSEEHNVYWRIKKIIIAYGQNPDEYEIYHPPDPSKRLMTYMDLLTKCVKESAAHKTIQKTKIERH